MKFCTIISVHDSRAENLPEIHEIHKIPAFPAPKRNEIRTTPISFTTQTLFFGKIYAERPHFSTFQRMHSMTPSEKHEIQNIKGSIFPLFRTILCPTANTQLACNSLRTMELTFHKMYLMTPHQPII